MKAVETASGVAKAVLFVVNLALQILQLAALYAGLEHWLGWHWSISALISVGLVFLVRLRPVTIAVAIVSAHHAWEWPWASAIGIFVGMFLVVQAIRLAAGTTLRVLHW